MPIDKDKLAALSTYIDGKIKRYNLMFAVNGGFFALAKLISQEPHTNPLGHLKLTHLAIGAIAFTFLMWFDIWLWGENMRWGYFDGEEVFLRRGKAILSMLAALLIVGWLFAIFNWFWIITVFVALAILAIILTYEHAASARKKRERNGRGAGTPHS